MVVVVGALSFAAWWYHDTLSFVDVRCIAYNKNPDNNNKKPVAAEHPFPPPPSSLPQSPSPNRPPLTHTYPQVLN